MYNDYNSLETYPRKYETNKKIPDIPTNTQLHILNSNFIASAGFQNNPPHDFRPSLAFSPICAKTRNRENKVHILIGPVALAEPLQMRIPIVNIKVIILNEVSTNPRKHSTVSILSYCRYRYHDPIFILLANEIKSYLNNVNIRHINVKI